MTEPYEPYPLSRLETFGLDWMSDTSACRSLHGFDYLRKLFEGGRVIVPAMTRGDAWLLAENGSPLSDLLPALGATAFLHAFGTYDEIWERQRAAAAPYLAAPHHLLAEDEEFNELVYGRAALTTAGGRYLEPAGAAERALGDAGWRFDPAERRVKALGGKRLLFAECVERLYEELLPRYLREKGPAPRANPNQAHLRALIAGPLDWFFPTDQLDPSPGGPIERAIRNRFQREKAQGFAFSGRTGYLEHMRR